LIILGIRHQRWSGRLYCTVDDLKEDDNMVNLLNIDQIDDNKLLEKIKKQSARMEKKIGMQDPNDETANELVTKMVFLDIGRGAPIAEQRGTQERISRMGLIPDLRRDIQELYEILGRQLRVAWIEF